MVFLIGVGGMTVIVCIMALVFVQMEKKERKKANC
jgi:hypothetical protein